MPAILDSLFHKVINTTSTPIGGVAGSHEVVGGSDLKILYSHTVSIQAVFGHISQNVAKSMPSLTSWLCGDFLLAAYLFRQDGAICKLPRVIMDVRGAGEIGLNKSRLLNFWLQYKHELLVHGHHIHQVVVKNEH